MDPDRWFSPKPNLQSDFQDVLKACKDKKTISFLSVAFIAGKKIDVKTRHEAAIKYMKTRVLISPAWSTNFQETLNEFKRAKGEYDNRSADAARVKLGTERQKLREQKDAARDRLEEARQKLREQEDAFKTEETREPAIKALESVDEVKTTSTDYYFQILAEDAVEPVFGRVFARLLQGVKFKAVFTRKDREYEEFRTMPHLACSSPRDKEEAEGHDISEEEEHNISEKEEHDILEDDEENPLGNLFE